MGTTEQRLNDSEGRGGVMRARDVSPSPEIIVRMGGGLLIIGKPQPGETAAVAAASGPVGSTWIH
jgi:hypothetical protein